jgi:hypothetical protein
MFIKKFNFFFLTLKIAKTHFQEKLKIESFSKKLILTLKALLPNVIPNMHLE